MLQRCWTWGAPAGCVAASPVPATPGQRNAELTGPPHPPSSATRAASWACAPCRPASSQSTAATARWCARARTRAGVGLGPRPSSGTCPAVCLLLTHVSPCMPTPACTTAAVRRAAPRVARPRPRRGADVVGGRQGRGRLALPGDPARACARPSLTTASSLFPAPCRPASSPGCCACPWPSTPPAACCTCTGARRPSSTATVRGAGAALARCEGGRLARLG